MTTGLLIALAVIGLVGSFFGFSLGYWRGGQDARGEILDRIEDLTDDVLDIRMERRERAIASTPRPETQSQMVRRMIRGDAKPEAIGLGSPEPKEDES